MDPDREPGGLPPRRTEFASIAAWLGALPTAGPGVQVAAGLDDVAWVDGGSPVAASVDVLAEDVHFRRDWGPPEAVGRRLLAAALSDLAASRAAPLGCLLALSLPPRDFEDPTWIDGVVRGIAQVATSWGCPVLGGDTTGSRSGAVLSATVLGTGGPPLTRGGAQTGESVWLSGPLGWTALAVRELLAGVPWEQLPEAARSAWAHPMPRLDCAPALASASAAVDISDGLLADAEHLARASGVRLQLRAAPLLDPGLAALPGGLELALAGGEDLQILATSATPLPGFTHVGEVVAGDGVELLDAPMPARRGWVHGERGS